MAAEVANDDTVSKQQLAELMTGHEITAPEKAPPTPGRVRTAGGLPACRSLDCVSVFALTVEDAGGAMTLETDFGDITVRNATEAGLDARTSSGAIRFSCCSARLLWIGTARSVVNRVSSRHWFSE